MDSKKPEDEVSTPTPAAGGIGGVMDVKPRETSDVSSPVAVSPVERSESMPEEPATTPPAPELYAPGEVHTETPAEPTAGTGSVSSPDGANRPGLSADLLAQAKKEVEKKSPDANDLLAAHASKKKGSMPKAAIAVAIVVALALSAAAVFAYLKTKEKESTPTVVNTTNQPAAATTNDVDGVTKDVDEAINGTGADQEMPESELSEQTLGL
jgi:hypothetical protein